MPPVHCPQCGHTDFYVISTRATFTNGALMESYTWPEDGDEVHDGDMGYEVEQNMIRDPELQVVEGPVKALCQVCLTDVTDQYLRLGRGSGSQLLPV
jgi:hypothetical protein